MKKIQYTYLILASVVLFALSSCEDFAEDFLTTKPTSAIENQYAFLTYDDCVKGVNGVYAVFKPYITRPIIFDAMTDDLFYARWGSNALADFRKWQFSTGSSEVSGIWSTNLQIVNNVNATLYGFDTVAVLAPFDAEQQANINRYRGELYLARAMATFDLLRCFSKPYDVNILVTAPGVPIVREVYLDYTEQPAPTPRSNMEETLLAIDTDLDSAAKYLPAIPRGATNIKGYNTTSLRYLSRAAMFAFKSRLELYRGNYRAVVAYCDTITDIYGFHFVPTAINPTEFAPIWTQDDMNISGEVIWMIALTSSDASSYAYGNNFNNATGGSKASPNFLPTGNLMNIYDPADFRSSQRGVYFLANSELAVSATSEPVTLVEKFPSSNNGVNYNLTGTPYTRSSMSKHFRYAEVWLNAIESLYKLGSYQQAFEKLNTFKARRNANLMASYTTAGLWAEIQKERRKEFAFEGMRWHDLKRWREGVLRPADQSSQTKFMAVGDDINISSTDYHWVFPIPQREVNTNPGIGQNDGY